MALALRRVFCTDIRTDSDFCFVHHKLPGFYNRGGKCLLRGTDWSLIKSRLRFVSKRLITYPFPILLGLSPDSTVTSLHTFLLCLLPRGSQNIRTDCVRTVAFLRLEKHGKYGVSSQILRDNGAQLLKTHTTGTFQGKPGRIWSLFITHYTIEVGKMCVMAEVKLHSFLKSASFISRSLNPSVTASSTYVTDG